MTAAISRQCGNWLMCEKCVELDRKIERCERISTSISDQLTIDRLEQLVMQMKAQKTALHPEQ
jgi:hypothetical protein